MRVLAFVVLIAVGASGTATVSSAAQAPANFAGRWRLVTPATSTPPSGPPAELLFIGPSSTQFFTIERHFSDGVKTETYSTDPGHPGMAYDARWTGKALVLLHAGNGGRGAAPATPDRQETWSLDAGDVLHIDVTEGLPRAQPTTTRLTYARLPAPTSEAGRNLLGNATADGGRADWVAIGDAKIETCGADPCFVLRNQGRFTQTIPLPADAAAKFLVMVGAGASERINPDGAISGLPYLYGMASGTDRIVGYFQGQDMRLKSAGRDQWATLSGVFPVPPGATRVNFQLSQAEARGTPLNGSAARFDDLGFYIFSTEAAARAFVNEWRSARVSVVAAAPVAPSAPAIVRQIPTAPTSTAADVVRDVHVKLSIRDGKSVFRSGEPIRLVASFTADQPGYVVDTNVPRMQAPTDDVVISPADGVFRWVTQYDRTPFDYVFFGNPLSAEPFDVTFPLNYWFRFDQPGEYTVRIHTRRAMVRGIAGMGSVRSLETNSVTFRVIAMTPAEEETETTRLSALVDGAAGCVSRQDVERCEDLAFLTGEAGTREKVRRLFEPPIGNSGNWSDVLRMGLYISPDKGLVTSLLEQRMRDVTKPATSVTFVSEFRLLSELPALAVQAARESSSVEALGPARLAAIRRDYTNEVLASLSQRSGNSRRMTALMLLQDSRTASGVREPVPPAVRQLIIDEFDGFEPTTQGMLVQSRWLDIRDPKLLPSLDRMAASRDPWVRMTVLAPLLELAPDRARPIFVAEMLDPRSMAGDVLFRLPDLTLPEVERPLLTQVTQIAASQRPGPQFSRKMALLARYGTPAIVHDIEVLYANWQRDPANREVGTALKAYLDRWHRAEPAGSPD